jgi:hypothetical protein
VQIGSLRGRGSMEPVTGHPYITHKDRETTLMFDVLASCQHFPNEDLIHDTLDDGELDPCKGGTAQAWCLSRLDTTPKVQAMIHGPRRVFRVAQLSYANRDNQRIFLGKRHQADTQEGARADCESGIGRLRGQAGEWFGFPALTERIAEGVVEVDSGGGLEGFGLEVHEEMMSSNSWDNPMQGFIFTEPLPARKRIWRGLRLTIPGCRDTFSFHHCLSWQSW